MTITSATLLCIASGTICWFAAKLDTYVQARERQSEEHKAFAKYVRYIEGDRA